MMGKEQGLIETEAQLIDRMTTPNAAVIEAVSAVDGPVLIVGVGGKMGPTLAELLVRAGAEVIGVARFSEPGLEEYLTSVGVRTVTADLFSLDAWRALPEASNVVMLVGYKFGAVSNLPETWAVNASLPGRLVERYPDARIVYLSSGNVYPFCDIESGGSNESDGVGPVGEYAQSRLGGERIAEHMAAQHGTKLLTVRLFYATELRYGIIREICNKVLVGDVIDLTVGHVNQIWQGDANAYLARAFPLCTNPATILNMTGPDILSVREIAIAAGELLGCQPMFAGHESDTALLGDASALFAKLGLPDISTGSMVRWAAHWVANGGRSLGKPTKYETRTGGF